MDLSLDWLGGGSSTVWHVETTTHASHAFVTGWVVQRVSGDSSAVGH